MRGFKRDETATAARRPQIVDGTLLIDVRQESFSLLDKASFISLDGHEILYGVDWTRRKEQVLLRDGIEGADPHHIHNEPGKRCDCMHNLGSLTRKHHEDAHPEKQVRLRSIPQ
jgi:hypothetical protein